MRITNNNSLFFILKSKIIILKHNNILIKPFLCFLFFFFLHLCCYCYLPLMGLVFWNSIHLEVPSDSFCFLINSSWLLVFILFMICWKGIYFSYNLLHIGLIFSFHYWCSSCPSRVNWKAKGNYFWNPSVSLSVGYSPGNSSENQYFLIIFWTSCYGLSFGYSSMEGL